MGSHLYVLSCHKLQFTKMRLTSWCLFYGSFYWAWGVPIYDFTIKCNKHTHTHTLSPFPSNKFTSNHNYSILHLLMLHTYCMISQRSNSITALISSEPWIPFGWADGDERVSDGEDGIRVPPNRVTCQLDQRDWCWSNMEGSSEQPQGATNHRGMGWARPAGVWSAGIWALYYV